MTSVHWPLGNLDQMAVLLHEAFTSYLHAGFSRHDALELCKAHIMAAQQIASQPPEDAP